MNIYILVHAWNEITKSTNAWPGSLPSADKNQTNEKWTWQNFRNLSSPKCGSLKSSVVLNQTFSIPSWATLGRVSHKFSIVYLQIQASDTWKILIGSYALHDIPDMVHFTTVAPSCRWALSNSSLLSQSGLPIFLSVLLKFQHAYSHSQAALGRGGI